MTDDLAFASLREHCQLLRDRSLSARELVESCLRRIERIDGQLGAFEAVDADRATRQADSAQAALMGAGDTRPLLGVPVAVKADFDIAGNVTTHGSVANRRRARQSAAAVRLLEAAGAVVIGTTRMAELAQWPFTESASLGPTRNPWDRNLSAGGSSGGSAAAVAAGLVPAALGTDGAGSIRIPAACCGVFGFKPQRDRVTAEAPASGWRRLVTVGPLTRTVADAALLTDAMLAQSNRPRPWGCTLGEALDRRAGRLRVAISEKVPPGLRAHVDADVRRALHHAAGLLEAEGHEVIERDPDYGLVALNGVVRYLRGIYDSVGEVDDRDCLEGRTRGMARMGRLAGGRAASRAAARETVHRARLEASFEAADLLVTPVLATPPPQVGAFAGKGALATFNGVAGFAPFGIAWNVTGHPAAAVPVLHRTDGPPLGVQLIARLNDEPTLLAAAATLEWAAGLTTIRPPVEDLSRAPADRLLPFPHVKAGGHITNLTKESLRWAFFTWRP